MTASVTFCPDSPPSSIGLTACSVDYQPELLWDVVPVLLDVCSMFHNGYPIHGDIHYRYATESATFDSLVTLEILSRVSFSMLSGSQELFSIIIVMKDFLKSRFGLGNCQITSCREKSHFTKGQRSWVVLGSAIL